jgi:hypothetical protein
MSVYDERFNTFAMSSLVHGHIMYMYTRMHSIRWILRVSVGAISIPDFSQKETMVTVEAPWNSMDQPQYFGMIYLCLCDRQLGSLDEGRLFLSFSRLTSKIAWT